MGNGTDWREGHLVFTQRTIYGRKTPIFTVTSATGAALGEIRWYSPWRRYVFAPFPTSIFDTECLHAIREFIHARMAERRTKPPAV